MKHGEECFYVTVCVLSLSVLLSHMVHDGAYVLRKCWVCLHSWQKSNLAFKRIASRKNQHKVNAKNDIDGKPV